LKPKQIMLIAGEASGDLLGAELVGCLREELMQAGASPTAEAQPLRTGLEPRFFGAGGPRMAAAGVDLSLGLTAHAVTGFSEVLVRVVKFRRFLTQLCRLAAARTPDAIICVDFSEFNRRLAQRLRRYVRGRRGWFHPWSPKIIKYVSPQAWASREGRAYDLARDHDLLLSIFPFEKDWYARRVPDLRVEFIGHPLLDRHSGAGQPQNFAPVLRAPAAPRVLLLPGSRAGELHRHLGVILGALALMRAAIPELRARIVLPDEALARQARAVGLPPELELRLGGLTDALRDADVAIASTGTVTMECACFGVPTVALYKTSWTTYQVAKRLVTVKHIAMPNILAGEEIYPEFIQHAATPGSIAQAALDLCRDAGRLTTVKRRLGEVVASLGGAGATRRAARAIADLL
jgi:lipid-A-disaccharide synthase